MPIAGLLSTERATTVCQLLQQVYDAARSLGCELTSPFGTLSFLALPVIPPLSFLAAFLFAIWTLVISVLFLRPEAATA